MEQNPVVQIIQENDEAEVAQKYRTDEKAMILLGGLGVYLGVKQMPQVTQDVLLEILRTTYYLGYKRGKGEKFLSGLTVAEE